MFESKVLSFLVLAALCLCSARVYGDEISQEFHRAFEQKYADMCVKKELALRKKENRITGSGDGVDPALQKLCECIARQESKTVTKEEAKKFLTEGKFPMSLMIKADQAEEVCGGE